MRQIDELLEITPKVIPTSDEETLIGLISGFCALCGCSKENNLVKIMAFVLVAMKGRGLNFRSLSDEYQGVLYDCGTIDAYHVIRMLTSKHSLPKKLIFAAGTLIAMGDRLNFDLLWATRKKIESFA